MTVQGGVKMVKERIYLDTSVPSAHDDARVPIRRAMTRKFWAQVLPDYDVYLSEITVAELRRTPDTAKRDALLALVAPFTVLLNRDEAEVLARTFIENEMLQAKKINDALHLAFAIVEGIEVLVSWNFDDMVNLRTKQLLPVLAARHGYFKQLTIVSPLEFVGRIR